jgi:hypothetical protein
MSNDRRNVNLISLISYLHNPTTFNNDTNRVNRPNCSKTALIKFTEEVYNRLFPSPSNTLEAMNMTLTLQILGYN